MKREQTDTVAGTARRTTMSAPVPVHGPARTSEALHVIIEDAFNRGDLDAFADAYEDDAVLVVPPDGRSVQGRDDIRAAAAPLFALHPHMTIVVDRKLEADERSTCSASSSASPSASVPC
jgi:hypothetical protein